MTPHTGRSYRPWLMGSLACVAACLVGVGLQARFGLTRLGPRRLQLWLQPPPTQSLPLPSHELALFALMGQSNMAGAAPPPYPDLSHPKIFLFANDYRWKRARSPLDGASSRGQVDPVSWDPGAGFGPGLPFARALLATQRHKHIGLLPCARFGSSISQWQRALGAHTLYGSCLQRIRAASTVGRLEAILFFQGEADAITRKRARQWGPRFLRFVEAWRKELGRPQLPVLLGQLGPKPKSPPASAFAGWGELRRQQALAAQKVHGVKLIATQDLATDGYGHFDVKGYVAIGRRFADALSGKKGP